MNRASANSPAPSPLGLDVLILEPDGRIAAEIVSALAEAAPDARVGVASSLGEAQQLVIEQKPALFVLDVDASYDVAQEFIYDLRTSHPNARAIILTAIHFSAQRDQVAGLGAIHFLEKPFPRADFIVLVEALLTPASQRRGETFQGTLSDLHIADIIQLKCIGGATSMLEFTGPEGEKARVYFENGQVRHAMAGAKEGLAAFNEIVDWKGGTIHEVPVPSETPRTIDLNWQVLLMEAVRTIDESREQEGEVATNRASASDAGRTILVVDDSLMLLSFLKEILEEQAYRVLTAPTASEGLAMARNATPDLILLDFVLPDMQGDEVCRNLMKNSATATIPVAYVSGLGSDLKPNKSELPNIIGSLSKPFTSDMLIKTVRSYLAGESVPNEGPYSTFSEARPVPEPVSSRRCSNELILRENSSDEMTEAGELPMVATLDSVAVDCAASATEVGIAHNSGWEETTTTPSLTAYFSGDSSFFPLHWALRTINGKKLTGAFRASWGKRSLELLARAGEIVLVTTHNPGLYCEETPPALLNVEGARIEAARGRQKRDGCPIFISLADEGLIQRVPALDQIQHYGQKLFSQLWTVPVRFVFEERELPHYAYDLSAREANIDQWALNTLRFVQIPHLGTKELCDSSLIPAYTCTGHQRLQELALAEAETQFASQINGTRSIAQISKSLRLDTKVTRLTLFRFLALELVQCWPARLALNLEARGRRRRFFSR